MKELETLTEGMAQSATTDRNGGTSCASGQSQAALAMPHTHGGQSVPALTGQLVLRHTDAFGSCRPEALSLTQIDHELNHIFDQIEFAQRTLILKEYRILDKQQKTALHGALVLKKRLTVISGPAGAGKSALIKILVLVLGEKAGIVTPTLGSRGADQELVDAMLPRKSFKPILEVHTTFTGFGVGFKEKWDAQEIARKIKSKDAKKMKALELYHKEVVICDEAAQTFYHQIDMATDVGPSVNGNNQQRFIYLMDGVQTPPVIDSEFKDSDKEMIWDGRLFQEAEADKDVACFGLETVYRSKHNAVIAKLSAALRAEDFDAAEPLVNDLLVGPSDEQTRLVEAKCVIVHDNDEVYEPAVLRHGSKNGAVLVQARCGNPHIDPTGTMCANVSNWPRELKKHIREYSKMLVDLYVYKGQRMLYLPIGKLGAKTDNGWYLSKGEPFIVESYDSHTHQLRVRCLKLKNALAWIPEEDVYVSVPGYGNRVLLWQIPARYDDIITVYSSQGSQYDDVHLMARRFKGKRNLLYTGVTRAIYKLTISGIESDDDGHDLLAKMELHPKSILWQMRLGVGTFSKERVAAAELEVEKLKAQHM